MPNHHQSGFISIAIIFILGMVTLLIGLSLLKTGYGEDIMSRDTVNSAQAFYLANGGLEEAIYRVSKEPTFGFPGPDIIAPTPFIDGGNFTVSVTGTETDRTIESTGYFGKFIRRVRASVHNTSLKPGFANAVHAGLGGVVMLNNTKVTVMSGPPSSANVYSNSFIKGKSNQNNGTTCQNSASQIDGSAYAVTEISNLNPGNGVCVIKDAYAANLNQCFVAGKRFSPNVPSVQCPGVGPYLNEPAPTPVPLPDLGISQLQSYLNHPGFLFPRDCIADGSGAIHDCTYGTNDLGNLYITGNLIKPSNKNLTISGPIWVTGNLILNSNGSIKPRSDITTVSQIIGIGGTITSASNIAYGKNGQAFLMFLSNFDPGTSPELVCSDTATPAIVLASNNQSVLFYSIKGCVKVQANSAFNGAILGAGIRIENNSTVNYDPALQTAIFGLTTNGGWRTTAFTEF